MLIKQWNDIYISIDPSLKMLVYMLKSSDIRTSISLYESFYICTDENASL